MGIKINTSRFGLIGLDMGSATIKAVKLSRRAGHYRVQALGLTPMPRSGPAQGCQDEEIIKCVDTCLRSLNTKHLDVVCALGGAEVVVRPFSFAPLPADEIPRAVKFEAMQVCPFNVEKSILDHQLIKVQSTDSSAQAEKRGAKQTASPITGILTAATCQAVSQKRGVVQKVGAKCVLMDVEGLALLNSIRILNKDEQDTIAVLNVGHQYSNLAVLPPTNLPFLRDISMGGEVVIDTLCQHTGLQPDQVMASLGDSARDEDHACLGSEALTLACKPLASEVRETLRYYGTQSAFPVEQLYLCGGFSQARGFKEQLRGLLLPYQLETWDPFEVLDCRKIEDHEEHLKQGSTFAVAVGLALRSI